MLKLLAVLTMLLESTLIKPKHVYRLTVSTEEIGYGPYTLRNNHGYSVVPFESRSCLSQ